MNFQENYDVVVIGGGHAGVEASLAAARMGSKTLLMTINLNMVAFMPCNPSIGGSAKGIVVREIDALGGEMGRNIDKTYIQMKMLNTGKGPAVRALRAQADKDEYADSMKNTVSDQENLTRRQGMVEELILDEEKKKVIGIKTSTGTKYGAKAVIITTGTALRGEIIIGELKYSSGPNNSLSSIGLADNLREIGFEIGRFKTGTPPRVLASSIDYDKTEIQPGDEAPNHFSFMSSDENYLKDQIPCWLTYTTENSHTILRGNLHRAPLFSGIVKGVGPRYCPSIEDKITRFADKPRHQLFLEPEGRNTEEVYIGGLSTSMPEDVQFDLVKSIPGLENAQMMRPGYAIEYDVVMPHQLRPTLETKLISGLFTAGQTNGTSGYEEAAGQGLVAGINAVLLLSGRPAFTLRRDEAYIGVLIDDLVTKGVDEPYRMFTSRAEYRILLRQDNADIRLTPYAIQFGLASSERIHRFESKKAQLENIITTAQHTSIKPDNINTYLEEIGSTPLRRGCKAYDLITRPEITLSELAKHTPALSKTLKALSSDREETIEAAEIEIKYSGYIARERQLADKIQRLENIKIRGVFDYSTLHQLSTEARQKLSKIDPETLAQASRIPGISPSDISVLLLLSGR